MNTFGLSEKRYEALKAYGNSDTTIGELIRLYGFNIIEKGYFIDFSSGNAASTVQGALVVETVPQFGAFSDNWEACRQAEKDGIKFINDMPGLERGYYVDTQKNRELCKEELLRKPELRIHNWIDIEDGEWGTRYAEHFGDPSLFSKPPAQSHTEKLILRTELPDRVEIGCYTDQVMPAGTSDKMLDDFWCGLLVVPRDWAEKKAKALGYADLDEFFSEYTWDDTIGWFSDAIYDGVLLGFSAGQPAYDEREISETRQPSLEEQMSAARQTAEKSAPAPTQIPEHERS